MLFRFTQALSAFLIVLVLLAPLVDNGTEWPDGWRRVVAIFARDPTVRRTATACALGLLVTAGVFFRPAEPPRPISRKRKHLRLPPPPPGMAGA